MNKTNNSNNSGRGGTNTRRLYLSDKHIITV